LVPKLELKLQSCVTRLGLKARQGQVVAYGFKTLEEAAKLGKDACFQLLVQKLKLKTYAELRAKTHAKEKASVNLSRGVCTIEVLFLWWPGGCAPWALRSVVPPRAVDSDLPNGGACNVTQCSTKWSRCFC
jgi:hypothetical protein